MGALVTPLNDINRGDHPIHKLYSSSACLLRDYNYCLATDQTNKGREHVVLVYLRMGVDSLGIAPIKLELNSSL